LPSNIKLVALDLDGTLLNNNGRIPPRNAQAIAQAQAQGVQIILATGKTRWSAINVIAELGLKMPGVFSQGLIVCDGEGQIMREITLEDRLAKSVLATWMAKDYPMLLILVRGC